MVEELFSAMQNRNVEEAYYDFALEQINNGLIRDLYMGSIAEAFEGFEQEPSEIMQEAEQLDDFMMEGISTEELVNEVEVRRIVGHNNLGGKIATGLRAAGNYRTNHKGSHDKLGRALHKSADFAFDHNKGITRAGYGVAVGAAYGAKKAYDHFKNNDSNASNGQTNESYGQLDDFMMEGQNCSSCCTDPAIVRAIDLLPESDPRDAGTFFSRTNAVNAEECGACCQEQFDLIDAIIPDTVINL